MIASVNLFLIASNLDFLIRLAVVDGANFLNEPC